MLGRSLKDYTKDAEKLGLIDLSDIEVASWREKVGEVLKKVSKSKSDYLLVTTGNQGEPNAILSRLGDEKYPYQQVSISVKSVRDELQDAEKVLKTAKEIKNNNNVTPSDYWKWTPQHIDEIVEKLRSLISLVQSLKR